MIFIYFNEVIMKEYIAKEYKYTQSKCKKFPATTYYTVFFITAGKCTCRSREKTYFCATEEIILVNPGTSVEIEYPASKTPLHFLQISFSAELLKRLSDEQTDLESCFHVVPYQVVVIQAESEISMLIKNLSKRLLTLPKETTDFGHALFQDSILSMLIVLLLRACIHVEQKVKHDPDLHWMTFLFLSNIICTKKFHWNVWKRNFLSVNIIFPENLNGRQESPFISILSKRSWICANGFWKRDIL